MSTPDRLLVVAHDADRGAEQLFLVRLVAALQAQPGTEVEVLLWQGGPLLAELQSLAPVRVVDDLNRWWLARLLQLFDAWLSPTDAAGASARRARGES